MIDGLLRMLPVHNRSDGAVDLLCVTADAGTLGFEAALVSAIHGADGPQDDVPSVHLAPLLGPGRAGSAPRRIRVAAAGVPPFDIVTDGALSVRTIARSALQPVPYWLAPFCAPLGVDALALDEETLVLLVDPRRLGGRRSLPQPAVPHG